MIETNHREKHCRSEIFCFKHFFLKMLAALTFRCLAAEAARHQCTFFHPPELAGIALNPILAAFFGKGKGF
jgi:hypothetical protein